MGKRGERIYSTAKCLEAPAQGSAGGVTYSIWAPHFRLSVPSDLARLVRMHGSQRSKADLWSGKSDDCENDSTRWTAVACWMVRIDASALTMSDGAPACASKRYFSMFASAGTVTEEMLCRDHDFNNDTLKRAEHRGWVGGVPGHGRHAGVRTGVAKAGDPLRRRSVFASFAPAITYAMGVVLTTTGVYGRFVGGCPPATTHSANWDGHRSPCRRR